MKTLIIILLWISLSFSLFEGWSNFDGNPVKGTSLWRITLYHPGQLRPTSVWETHYICQHIGEMIAIYLDDGRWVFINGLYKIEELRN